MKAKGKKELGKAAPDSALAGIRGMPAGMQAPGEAMPIWFSALICAHCHALVNGQPRTVWWNCVSGRAQYTNFGPDTAVIHPLGATVHAGHTLAVSWAPGATTYTMQVFRALDYLV